MTEDDKRDTNGVQSLMARPKKTVIHVNQHVIRANRKTGAQEPVLTVKQGKTNRYAHTARIDGPSTVVYRPERPLACGAHVWIETTSPVILDEPD